MTESVSLLRYADQAERLAAFVKAHAHADRLTLDRDKFWHYRAYQGGDAIQTIDWRQSARTDTLLVREREKANEPRLRFWNGLPRHKDAVFAPLLLAIAYLALDTGASVGWLDETLPPIKGRSRYALLSSRSPLDFTPSPMPKLVHLLPETRIVYASAFDDGDLDAWRTHIDFMQAQGAHGILYRIGPSTDFSRALDALARKSGWIAMNNDTSKRVEDNLMLLFEAVIASRG